MNQILKSFASLERSQQTKLLYSNRESGAALIMVYLAIMMFLFIAVLFLDIPYMERVGRSIQRCADAAALAGAIQLTARNATNADPDVQLAIRKAGWIKAKRAVFAVLKANQIAGAEAIVIDPVGGDGPEDTLDPGTPYRFAHYPLTAGALQADLIIQRGVYERPVFPPVVTPQVIFYPMEVGNPGRSADNCTLASGIYPKACPAAVPVYLVADSVKVTLSFSNIPTLFAKLLGINSYTTITRTAVSGPE